MLAQPKDVKSHNKALRCSKRLEVLAAAGKGEKGEIGNEQEERKTKRDSAAAEESR